MPKFSVTQSIRIAAPIEQIYAVVLDMHKRAQWSPWIVQEPDCPITYSNDHKAFSWDGQLVGSGELKITAETENESIEHQLAFLKPWRSTSATQYSFQETDGQVEVTWSLQSSLPPYFFFMKNMMVGMISMDFSRGLIMLKDLIETGDVPSKIDYPGQSHVEATHYVGIRSSCAMSELGPKMEQNFTKLYQWKKTSQTAETGPPFTLYHNWNLAKGTSEFTTAIQVGSEPARAPDGCVVGFLPPTDTFQVTHTGAYRHLGNAWSAGMARGRKRVFKQNKKLDPFEFYPTEPGSVEESEIQTHIHFPVK